jgi:hypothetical protein
VLVKVIWIDIYSILFIRCDDDEDDDNDEDED